MTLNFWAVHPIMPTITKISPAAGPITGLTPVTITGTGFVASGTTVNFVEEAAGLPASDNTILPATSVVVSSGGTQVTADSPVETEGTTYYVTVTTPTGTSAYSQNAIFTYAQVTPTISRVSVSGPTLAAPGGGTNGGTAVTIYGTGFYSGDTVNFVEANSSYQEVSSPAIVPANHVAISNRCV